MNSKLLNLSLNRTVLYKQCVIRCIFSVSGKNSSHISVIKNVQPNHDRFQHLQMLPKLSLGLSNQVRWMRGGPGYTKFAHGRFKQTRSKIAYLWYKLILCFT